MKIFSMFGDILVNDKASGSLDKIDKKTDTIGKKFTSFIGGAAKMGAGIVAGATVAIAGLVKLTDSFGDFESQLNNVGTLLEGDVNSRLEEMGDSIKQLSLDANTDTALLTDGLYQVVSAFGDSAESMDILTTAAMAARAGNATVTDSVNLLSAVMKGYNDVSGESAEKTSDLAFMTVKLGQTTYPELAASMGKVIPLAATLKIKQEELFGASATLTGVTGNTAEVMTQLRGIMSSIINPSDEMTEAVNRMGFANASAAVETLGLNGFLTGLKDQVDGNEVAFANMFGRVEATTAALALTGNQADAFREKSKAMEDVTGATNKAFDQQNKGLNALKEQFMNYIKIIGIEVGEKLLPLMNKLLKFSIDNAAKFLKHFDSMWKGMTSMYLKIKNIIFTMITEFQEWRESTVSILDLIELAWYDFVIKLEVLLWRFIDFSIELWKNHGDDLIDILRNTWDDIIIPLFRTSLNTIENIYDASLELMRGSTVGFTSSMYKIFLDWFDLVVDLFHLQNKTLEELMLESFFNLLRITKWFVGGFERLASAMIKAIVEGFFWVVDELIVLENKMKDWIDDLIQKMIQNGKDLVDGLIVGVKLKTSEFINTVRSMGERAANAFKKFFKIQSPSKLMRSYGQFIGEGLTLGIADTEQSLMNQVDTTAKKTGNAFGVTRENSTVSNGSSNGGSSIIQNITINSPTQLDAAEIARQTKKASQQLAVV